MNLTETDAEGNVIPRPSRPTQRDIPYDDPFPFFRGMMAAEEPEPVEPVEPEPKEPAQSREFSITYTDYTSCSF
jgi:hypothetical protein